MTRSSGRRVERDQLDLSADCVRITTRYRITQDAARNGNFATGDGRPKTPRFANGDSNSKASDEKTPPTAGLSHQSPKICKAADRVVETEGTELPTPTQSSNQSLTRSQERKFRCRDGNVKSAIPLVSTDTETRRDSKSPSSSGVSVDKLQGVSIPRQLPRQHGRNG
jgi:hypothetical protein